MRVSKSPPLRLDSPLREAFAGELKRRDVAPATIRSYLSDLRALERWFRELQGRAAARVDRISDVELVAFRHHLIREKGLKATTVNRRIQSLRTFFSWLREKGVVAEKGFREQWNRKPA
jgi:site-specific recombinase XerD